MYKQTIYSIFVSQNKIHVWFIWPNLELELILFKRKFEYSFNFIFILNKLNTCVFWNHPPIFTEFLHFQISIRVSYANLLRDPYFQRIFCFLNMENISFSKFLFLMVPACLHMTPQLLYLMSNCLHV